MSERFGRVRSALGFFCVMAVSAAAMAGSAAAPVATADSAAVARVVLSRTDASPQRPTGAARPLAVSALAVSAIPGQAPAASTSEKPPAPARKAKSYALVLASFAMLGVIALQRLVKVF